MRVLRRTVLLGVGKVTNIQTNKQNVDRVESGTEFGAQIEVPFAIERGDIVECFITVSE